MFHVAGSGKTQRILDWYCKAYGHYLVAPELRKDPAAPENRRVTAKGESPRLDQDILTLRRGGASRDMELMYMYSIPTCFYGNLGFGDCLLVASARLKINRDMMLMGFDRKLEVHQASLQTSIKTDPQRWLLFQTVCGSGGNGFDPSYSAFKNSFAGRQLP